jgi:hypothetical protein
VADHESTPERAEMSSARNASSCWAVTRA